MENFRKMIKYFSVSQLDVLFSVTGYHSYYYWLYFWLQDDRLYTDCHEVSYEEPPKTETAMTMTAI